MTPLMFDLGVASILLVSAVISFFRGLVREVLTILTLIGAGLAAWKAGPALKLVMLDLMDGADGKRETFFDLIPVKMVADVSAYAAVFVAVFIALSLISHMISKGVKGAGLGAADRTLGVIFGLLRGLALLVLVFILFAKATEKGRDNYPEWMKNAKTLPLVEAPAEWLRAQIPFESPEKPEKKEDLKTSETPASPAAAAVPATPETVPQAPPAPGYDDTARDMMQNLIQKEATP